MPAKKKITVAPAEVKQLLPGETLTEYTGFGIYAKESPRKDGSTYHYYDLLCADGKKRRVPGISTLAKTTANGTSQLVAWAEKEAVAATVRAIRERKLPRTVEPKDAIKAIQALKTGAESAKVLGMRRGTMIHEAMESLIAGGEIAPETLESYPGYSEGLMAWFSREKPKPILQEIVVGSPQHGGYAGRLDLVAEINGKRVLLDLKTSAAGGIYPEAHVQAAGYSLAMTECGLEAPERMILLGISEAGIVTEEEGQGTAEDFLTNLTAYNARRALEKRIREAGDREHEWTEVVV